MRIKDMGLPVLPLGTRVVYSHRASAIRGGHTMRDVRGAVQRACAWRALGKEPRRGEHHYGTGPLRVYTVGGHTKPLTSWVVVWPEWGSGMVAGLTYRNEGWYHAGGPTANPFEPVEYDAPYLDATARHPLYVVKRNLTEAGALVPPWACVPHPPAPWSVVLGLFADPPVGITLGDCIQPWDSWVARYVERKGVAV